MRSFKEQMERDRKAFHNPAEFAAVSTVSYDGKCYTIPIIVDDETTQDRERMADDHAEGINRTRATVFITLEDMGIVPEEGYFIEIGQAGWTKEYKIIRSGCKCGEIVLVVEAYDE